MSRVDHLVWILFVFFFEGQGLNNALGRVSQTLRVSLHIYVFHGLHTLGEIPTLQGEPVSLSRVCLGWN